MRMADWLTYTDIEQLKRLNQYYGCQADEHSKHDLICSLLRHIHQKSLLQKIINELTPAEYRFLQLLVLDNHPSFTMEELLAKGRAALNGEPGEPRSFVVGALKKGWLFPGYSLQTQYLYHVPFDTREKMIELLLEPYQQERREQPSFYRDEEMQIVYDLYHFLEFIKKEVVRLTHDGAIYKQQQRQLFQSFFITEEPISEKGPRFGFGRRYHLYPDRFSLIYDYAYYQGYFAEEDGYLSLSETGFGKITRTIDENEAKNLYRFWIRLYRKPIHHLPILIRWIGLLAHPGWFPLDRLYSILKPWLTPFYYETPESLFQKMMRMLCHLGVVRLGNEDGRNFVSLTQAGCKWMHGISAFREKVIEDGFIRIVNEDRA
ncbi:hypothetical protein [Thermoflavimicrobium dichotomicum]|uniref:Uncharacterized protein n=1 Tax=Thermoflavimicrobium dichotomicum TaxID=46223 RepID=A0A1I3SN03_9BACL|nr:hypothetical protein [Thermoflavimicrobium dichotomicum]SFJ58777.1 hypothetical protein SAMN05421852_11365 [Thermoflavimicrobium dichotomicum]